jgi:Uma2 family endonuclease
MASTAADLRQQFRELEARLEKEPEHLQGEIARGAYLMSPRPRPRHGGVQGNVFSELRERFGKRRGSEPPDWLFVVEPELRSERTFSRLVPDVAAWRRSSTGWPDLDRTPVEIVPDWVLEVLSSSTEGMDRGEKLGAYGSMGVGWVWLIDCDRRRVETFVNTRGQMLGGAVFSGEDSISGEPFGEKVALSGFFL